MKLQLAKASTNVTVYVFIQDSSATTGAGLAGLVFNSAGLVASQVRPLAARAPITLATQTVTGAHSDGGFVEVDSANMPGIYRLDLPDAVCATGVDSALVMLKGATNMAPVVLEIQLTNLDLNDGTRAGLTALPNFAAGAVGGLPDDTDANGRVRVVAGTGAGELNLVSGVVDANVEQLGGDATASSNMRTDYLKSGIRAMSVAHGTAQSGTASTIVLAASSAFADNELNGNVISILGGTGIGQTRVITSNTLADDTCNVYPNWATNPSSDSIYSISQGSVNVSTVSLDGAAADNLELDYDGTGYVKANSTIGTTTTNTDMITAAAVNAEVDTALADIKLDHLVAVADADDAVDNSIVAKLASTTGDWSLFVPTTDSLQSIRDAGVASADISAAVWDEDATGHQTAGTFGQAIGDPGANTETMYDAVVTDAAGTNIAADLIALNDLSTTDILTQVNSALDTAISELGVAAPTATPTLRTGLMLLYMMARNKLVVQTSGTDAIEVYNDAGTKIAAKTITDDGSDYTEAEMA